MAKKLIVHRKNKFLRLILRMLNFFTKETVSETEGVKPKVTSDDDTVPVTPYTSMPVEPEKASVKAEQEPEKSTSEKPVVESEVHPDDAVAESATEPSAEPIPEPTAEPIPEPSAEPTQEQSTAQAAVSTLDQPTETAPKAEGLAEVVAENSPMSDEPAVLDEPIIDYDLKARVFAISCVEGAEIYYTLDPALPEAKYSKYDKPISIKRSTLVKAYARKNGLKDSPVASKMCEVVVLPEERIRLYTGLDKVIGMSYQGEGHIRSNTPCQDYHSFNTIEGVWNIAISSDGAGSAKYSADGSKAVCLAFTHYISRYLHANHPDGTIPDAKEWDVEFRAMLCKFQNELSKQAEQTGVEFKSLAATINIIVYSPKGYLVAHVGDGRAAVKTQDGWKAVITPHKGEEANQTIFSTSIKFCEYPNLKMCGVYVPETSVSNEPIDAFVVMSDGCECGLWHMNEKIDLPDGDFRIEERNIPFAKGLDEALSIITLPEEERKGKFLKFITSYNRSLEREIDDKTILIGYTR